MKVLLAVDIGDEDFARGILDFVSAQHWPDGSSVRVLHALSIDEAESFGGKMEARSLVRDAQVAAHESASQFAQALNSVFSTGNVETVVERGHASSLILDQAKDWPADIIILGSRGHRGLKRLFLGSVSAAVAANAPCTVMVVGREVIEEKQDAFKRVLIPVIDLDFAEGVLELLLEHDWKEGAEFKFLYVQEPLLVGSTLSFLPSAVLAERKESNLKLKTALLTKLKLETEEKLKGVEVSTEIIEGFPKDVILRLAIDWKASLIAMGSHGRRGINRFILGSVSSGVLNHAPCSVLIVH